eukprot:TRINITY_DN1092_c0_g2_i2.p1 TRINITY_DN1092_c0_g2~~TRINITY_DN1092_c0_g2_i2.p1  ORF type:complete len:1579 (-),score=272.12 TRINITY_DN1092_c0_g2_i2:50-4357(-)
MCCEEIRNIVSPSEWSGEWSLTLTPNIGFTPTTVVVDVPKDSHLLPILEYYSLVPMSMDCLDSIVCVSACHRNVPSTSDPFFSYEQDECFSKIGDIYQDKIVLESDPNSISTLFWIEKINFYSPVPVLNFGIGREFLKDNNLLSTCKPQYSWLVNSEGQGDLTVTVTVSPRQTTCDYEALSTMTKGFDDVLSVLNEGTKKSQNQTDAILDLAHLFPASLVWTSCLEMAKSHLNTVEEKVIVSTTDCQEKEGTPEWLADACCNEALSSTTCCLPKLIEVNTSTFVLPGSLNFANSEKNALVISADEREKILQEEFQECSLPGCALQPLKSLVDYGIGRSCYKKSLDALSDPRFTANPFEKCAGMIYGISCFYDILCNTIGPGSRCMFPSLRCSVPCETDADCFLGTCQETRGFGKSCMDTPEDPNMMFEAWSQCLFTSIDPFLAALIQDEINQDDSLTLGEQFQKRITQPACVDSEAGLMPWPTDFGPLDTKEQCDNAVSWCPWWSQYVVPDALPKQPVSYEFCNTDFPSSHICALDFNPLFKIVGSRPDVCEVRMKDHGWYSTADADQPRTQVECEAVGGVFVSVVFTRFQFYGPCLHPVHPATPESCYSSDCIDGYMGERCHSYCRMNRDEMQCNGQVNGRTLTWESGKCVLEWVNNANSTIFACTSDGGEWVQGYDFGLGFYNTNETCHSICWNSVELLLGFTPENCELFTCSSCTEQDVLDNKPHCSDPELCAQTEACTNPPGCIIPHVIYNTLAYKPPCLWTPRGCLTASTKDICDQTAHIGFWSISPFTDKESCESFAGICKDPRFPNATVEGAGTLPQGYTNYNEEECNRCGMIWEPFYKWVPGRMIQKRSNMPLKWMPRESTRPVWKPKLDAGLFGKLLESARASRSSSILSSQLYCEFGVEKELLSSLACNCGEGGGEECQKSVTSPVGSIVGFVTACQNVPGKIEEAGLVFDVASNFEVSTGDLCSKIRIVAVLLEQFTQVISKTYSSLAIISETRASQNTKMFVYNGNGALVGQLLSDGYGFQFNPDNATFPGLKICFPVPKSFASWQLLAEMHSIDIAWASFEEFEFHPLKRNISISEIDELEHVCIDVSDSEPRAYFFIGLVHEWEDVEIRNTWSSPELGLIITCNVIYVFLVLFTAFVLAGRLIIHFTSRKEKNFVDFPKIAVFSVLILSILRAVYFFGMPFGTFDDVEIQVVFSDLPALLFMIAVVATGCMWAHLHIMTSKLVAKSKHAIIQRNLNIFFYSFCASLCLLFVVLQSVFGGLLRNRSDEGFTCATTEAERNALSSSEIVSILYKAFFALYCVVIAVVFCFYGINSLKALKGTTVADKDSIIQKFCSVTFFCTIGLLIQASILLATTIKDLPNTTKLALILASETVPCLCLSILFLPDSMKTYTNVLTKSTKASKVKSKTKSKSDHSKNESVTK